MRFNGRLSLNSMKRGDCNPSLKLSTPQTSSFRNSACLRLNLRNVVAGSVVPSSCTF